MSPINPKHDQVDGSPVDAEFFCKRSLAFSKGVSSSYFDYFLLFKFCCHTSFASALKNFPVPSFRPHIQHIFGIAPKPKVIWPHTRRIVAIVANIKGWWDWPKMKNPGSYVSANLPVKPFTSANSAIASSISRTGPKPARFRFVDLFPKPIFTIFGKVLRSEVLGGNFDHFHGSFAGAADRSTGFFILTNSALKSILQPS